MKGKKEQKLINTILSQDITLLLRPVISSRGDPVLASFKRVYYFQFLILEIIRFAVWFYVLDVTFPRLLISSAFVSQIYNIEGFVQQNLLCYCCSLNFCVICNIFQSLNVCPKSAS